MKNFANKLNENYYLLLIILVFIVSIVSFLSIKGHIHSIFKHISFLSLIVIGCYMFPFQILKSNNKIQIISKILICSTVVYIALCSFLTFNNFELLGKILYIIIGFFTFFLLSFKEPEYKVMFKSHFILNFVLVGVVTMFFFK